MTALGRGAMLVVVLAFRASLVRAQRTNMNELKITRGTVSAVGTQRVGVRWVWEDDYVDATGKKEHGMAAGLSLFPPERRQTVGRGSEIDIDRARYEVTSVVDGAPPTVTLRRLP